MDISTTFTASTSNAVPLAGSSHTGLEAQLNRLKKQLSDCVNCESAKTPEGKTRIQELTGRVSQTESHLRALRNNAPDRRDRQPATDSVAKQDRAAPTDNVDRPRNSPLGVKVDLFA